MKKASIPESAVAGLYFDYHGTLVFDQGAEIDIFRADDDAFEVDIRVTMVLGGGKMQYSDILLTDRTGVEIVMTGPKGGPSNREMSEVTLWEKIEKSDQAEAYYYSRPPVSVALSEGLKILEDQPDAMPDPA